MARVTTERSPFAGAVTVNAELATPRKALIITGSPRGGTSFAASIFLRLGVPFDRGGREISKRTHEHWDLRDAFQAGKEEDLRRIAGEFAEKHPVWGWKLPAVQTNFDIITRNVASPHFVFVFKETVGVAFRKTQIKGTEFVGSLNHVLVDYVRMATFAETARVPMFFISYEAALADLEVFLRDAARFAGIDEYDERAVIRAIKRDGTRYYPGGGAEDDTDGRLGAL